jgi:hypothetical protein
LILQLKVIESAVEKNSSHPDQEVATLKATLKAPSNHEEEIPSQDSLREETSPEKIEPIVLKEPTKNLVKINPKISPNFTTIGKSKGNPLEEEEAMNQIQESNNIS